MVDSVIHQLARQLITVFILTNTHLICTSIVDTKTPIVIQDSIGDGQSGSNEQSSLTDNYFGYSLAFMKGPFEETGLSPSISRAGNAIAGGNLFIGAPNEKRATRNSGVVWQCKFDGNNAELSCSILESLSNVPSQETGCSERRYLNLYWPENVTEQWIGASLSTTASSNLLLAGAPRWKLNSWRDPYSLKYRTTTCQESALVGACYVTSSPTDNPVVLKTLNDPGRFYYTAENKETSEYWFLYGELGFSSHVTSTDNLILGAPSVRNWRGALIEYRGESFNDPLVHNALGDISNIAPHSYLGYTVTSLRTQYGRGYYIVSGAPRGANLLGIVTISSPSRPRPIFYYRGEQFGSYFGYALAGVDLNGDGNDELIVGAPLHTTDFKSASAYSQGCIFIYYVSPLSSTQRIDIDLRVCMDPQISKGGRFGSSISNLGDINNDNKEDFAVSAPYDDEGKGTVFIYLGGGDMSRPFQTIRGKSMNIQNLYGFGTFLLSGRHIDIDGNGTPDFIVSSFESRYVAVLRTRPIATASIRITFHKAHSNDENERIFKLAPLEKGFRARICFQFEFSVNLPEGNRDQLNVLLRYVVDPNEKRVDFVEQRDNTEHSYPLSAVGKTCLDKQLQVIKEISHENNERPISVTASVKYNETLLYESQPVQHAGMVLNNFQSNQQSQQYQQAYRSFKQYLPAPIPPVRESEFLEIAKDNCDSDNDDRCDPVLHLFLEGFYKNIDGKREEKITTGKALVIGQLDSLIVSMVVSNSKETAYQPTLRVTYSISNNFEVVPTFLRNVWRDTPGRPGQCTRQGQVVRGGQDPEIILIMRCPQPLQGGAKMKYTLEIGNLKNLKIKNEQDRGQLRLKVEAYPESREEDKLVIQTVGIPLNGDVVIDVESKVPSTGQSEIDPKRTRVVDLTQLYNIRNSGYSGTAADMVKAVILVPTHVNFEKGNNWTQVIGIANPSNLNVRCEAVNSKFFSIQELGKDQKSLSNSTAIETPNLRSTRSTTKSSPLSLKVVHPEKVSVSQSSEKFITLSGCEDVNKVPAGSCQKIECFMDMPSKGSRAIKIQMFILRNAIGKLLSREDTRGIRIDSIISVFYAGKKVDEKIGSTQRGLLLVKSVPAWVYLASGAGGTILFLLIAFALFKCGFFRRKRKEELQKLKRQTMQQLDADALLALDASIEDHEESQLREQ